MRAYLFDVEKNELRLVDIPKENYLDTYHDLIGCRCIDICRRKVGSKNFEIVVDDEGLFAEKPIVSALSTKNYPECILVGNLLFFGGVDFEGNLTEITDDDVKIIDANVLSYVSSDGSVHKAIKIDW